MQQGRVHPIELPAWLRVAQQARRGMQMPAGQCDAARHGQNSCVLRAGIGGWGQESPSVSAPSDDRVDPVSESRARSRVTGRDGHHTEWLNGRQC